MGYRKIIKNYIPYMTRAKYIFFGQIYKFIISCNGKMICKLYKYTIQILFKNARKNLNYYILYL